MHRAQLSPITRTLTIRIPEGLPVVTRAPLPTPTTTRRFGLTTADTSPAASIGRIWTPGLLDRLQAPLTRYRE